MKVYLVQRSHDYYDVIIGNKKVGSGSWGYVSTAYYFYKMEEMDVEIVYE